MWNYEKRLQYPVNIKQTNPKIAQVIMSQYGGPDGELGASMRYISQRYTMPYREVAGILNDIGTDFCCSYQAAPSAAISSIKSVIGSPFDWNSQALNGMPPAACGQIPNV